MKTLHRLSTRALATASTIASTLAFSHPQLPLGAEISFRYQPYYGSEISTACTHEKSSVGVHEWDVKCDFDGNQKKYDVHLVLSFYPRTIEGGSGYELLYWVTDASARKLPHDSVTQWIHLPTPDAKVKKLESYLGVENDQASLQLSIRLP